MPPQTHARVRRLPAACEACASATSPPPAARSLARERELYSLSVAARRVHRSIAIRFRNYIGTG
jgi:hypothetical protein